MCGIIVYPLRFPHAAHRHVPETTRDSSVFIDKGKIVKIVLVNTLERQLPDIIEGPGYDLCKLAGVRMTGNPSLDIGCTRKVIRIFAITGRVFHYTLSDILLLKYYGFVKRQNNGQLQDFTGNKKRFRDFSPHCTKIAPLRYA